MHVRPLDSIRADLPAGLVVFLVAVPLCLGIALASGAPLFAGIIAGAVGGIVVGAASGSPLGVSGPAAGLTVIVLNAITALGSFEAFLLAVVVAGLMQLALGAIRAGVIGYYFPSAVIKGMLTGIGLTIILKQLPHAVGFDPEPEGNMTFVEPGGETTLSALAHMLNAVQPGALVVALVSLAILLTWDRPLVKQFRAAKWIQGPLVAVAAGIGLNALFAAFAPQLAIEPSHLVQLPVLDRLTDIGLLFTLPDFSQVTNPAIYSTAATLAVVASLETLLCVEATDRLDPLKRVTPTDRELKAQGLGNIVSGLVGGLPLTQVIVRSSANIQSGARTKLAAITHGVFLVAAVLLVPSVLNMIPLATLAAVLLTVGYKLATPALFAQMYRQGWEQFAPFLVTVVGILATDLLVGIGLGMAVAVFLLLLTNYRNPYSLATRNHRPGEVFRLELSEDVSFLNRAAIRRTLDAIPPGTRVEIDATRSVHIDHDVFEILEDYRQKAAMHDIALTIVGLSAAQERPDAMREVSRVIRRERKRVERQGALATSLGQ